jgi:hypothetical protein
MGVRRLDIRFGNIAGQGATSLFVSGASCNIGGLAVACNGVGQRKRLDRPCMGCHSISHAGVGRGARRISGTRRKPPQNNTRRVSIFIYLHWSILMSKMSTKDNCNLAACGLIQLRGPAVLNENAIRGSIGKIINFFFAPNIIFSVGSCICMLYDLTCQVLLKKSTHSQSYGV